ncbi:hypothetical protein E8E11_008913 [Didymella keratinophila]|nr:hypothetical protein E8E11_008913 [Didymella keratinophila]
MAAKTMKAVRVMAYHAPMEMQDVPRPTVQSPLDVIVKVGAAGVCRTDIHICDGEWKEKSNVELPYTIGHENAGWVHEVGSSVSNVKVGDKDSKFPDTNVDGGYAEYIRTTARSVIKLDDKLEPSDVAALADAGLTAYHVVAKAARILRPGDYCVMIGAGDRSHWHTMHEGHERSNVDCRRQQSGSARSCLAIGADHTVQVDKDGSFVEKVMKLTQGKGAASVIDFVAEGGSTKTGVKMLRRAGNYYIVGYGENLDIPTIDIISTEINFVGNLVGSYNDLAELMVLAAQGKVKLHTSKYKLADYERAVQNLRDGKVRGRAILEP